MAINNLNTANLKTQATSIAAGTSTQQTLETNEDTGLFSDTTVTTGTENLITEAEEKVDKLNSLTALGESMGLQLEGVDLAADLEKVSAYLATLDAKIAEAERTVQQKEQELTRLQAEQSSLQADETEQNNRLSELNSNLSENQNKMAEINTQIAEIQEQNESAYAEYSSKYETQKAAAAKTYNPEKDGDFETFIEKKMSGLAAPTSADASSYQSDYDSISSDSESIENTINTISTQTLPNIKMKLNITSTQISAAQLAIDTAKQDVESINAQKESVSVANIIKSYIPEAEWNLVEANNLDLSETLEDGSPKYLLAKGKSDNKYHLYDRNATNGQWAPGGNYNATSVARIYGCNSGLDIVEAGNGYITNYKTSDEDTGFKSVPFTMSCDGSDATYCVENCCYTTCSPLAFDLNENGIETSDEKIMYDINGDGKLDEINNVLEGILAFDKDGDGIAGADGSELFGNNTDLDGDGVADGYKDGFEALKALAFKESLINGADDMILDEMDLDVLLEKYGLGMKVGGYNSKTQSLKSLGIAQINLASTSETSLTDNFDGKYNQLMTQEGATFVQNGREKDYVDVWNAVFE